LYISAPAQSQSLTSLVLAILHLYSSPSARFVSIHFSPQLSTMFSSRFLRLAPSVSRVASRSSFRPFAFRAFSSLPASSLPAPAPQFILQRGEKLTVDAVVEEKAEKGKYVQEATSRRKHAQYVRNQHAHNHAHTQIVSTRIAPCRG
jgi:hypothetical protein